MTPASAGLLAVAVAAEIAATSALKASDGFSRPLPAALALGGYVVAFVFLSFTMRTVAMGIIYALWSGIGIVAIAGIGWAVYGERLDGPALVGIGLILAGVLVLNLFSASIR